MPSMPSGTSFSRRGLGLLEVAVARAVLHRADRAHAAVALERAALVQDQLARALVGAREERADHHRRGAGGDRLGDVARELDAAVGDDRRVRSAAAARAASAIAVICGMPAPETTRVVQIEPGPMPTLTALTPAAIRSAAPS